MQKNMVTVINVYYSKTVGSVTPMQTLDVQEFESLT